MSEMCSKLCSREVGRNESGTLMQISQLATRSNAFRRGTFFAWVSSYCFFFFIFPLYSYSFLTSDSSSVSPFLLSLINWLAGWLASYLVPGSSACSLFSLLSSLSFFSYSLYLFYSYTEIISTHNSFLLLKRYFQFFRIFWGPLIPQYFESVEFKFHLKIKI